MKYFVNDPNQPDAKMAFLDKLLQLQDAYYSYGSEKSIIKQILFELGEYTTSSTVVLISHEDRNKDYIVQISSTIETVNLENTMMAENEEVNVFEFKSLHLLQCGIKIDNNLSWTIYLIHTCKFDSPLKAVVELTLSVLKGLLADQARQMKKLDALIPGKDKKTIFSNLTYSLDGAIFELTEQAVVKRMWIKDKTRRFLPLEFLTDIELSKAFFDLGSIFASTIEELMVTGEKQECIYPDRSKVNWFSAKFQKVYSARFEARIICEIEDITVEKRLSDQLKLNATEMERINNLLEIGLDISKMCGWEYDLNNKDLIVTKQIHDITGSVHHQGISHRQLLDFFEAKQKLFLLRTLRNSYDHLSSFDLELELVTSHKQKKWIRLSGIPVIESGKVRFFRGILKDITRHNNDRLELIEAKNLAEQVARKRTEILSIMSHEIRTPLNGIIGICNLLNQIALKDKETASYIKQLSFSSDHLLQLVNDFLDLEKLDSKKMELNEKETNLIDLVQQIKMQFLPLIKAKKIELNVHCDEKIPSMLWADELRLSRVLNNLIGNSIKFTEKGEINITLKTVEQSRDFVKILFRIADTGIGIPEHFHNIIFDKFHQVEQSPHRQQQGTGLGLSITKGLLKLFKSEIVLASKPGEGTVFEFEINFRKVLEKNSIDPDEAEPIEPSSLPHFNLLIVDDNQINLLVTKNQVKNFGVDADLAENGYMALELMMNKIYHIVLVDLHMPGMDGYELAKYIQNNYPETKIIIFTADILDEVIIRLENMGVSNVLSKPFKPKEMYDILLKVLEE
ncbi:PAS domain-containing hybrid sensor histidine kinase/response regulator [Pedobacter cryoconitis]|uniref:histidine kinase n=1 Tax=Pedobacter cryoconitis TaxID=188932 RepID=A0A7X0MJ04_9SPHI|nr:PAS domain-containing hybrid sensor histidine kinase/response regulator [Pedobacter cryoconitis]MBB6498948.1 signal transduction histidine kinase [Pedobacter cryoconitis]